MFLYPLAIVLILLALSSSVFQNRQAVFAGAMFLTFFISIIDGYNALVESVQAVEVGALNAISEFYQDYLPLYDLGLGWIVPAISLKSK